MTIKRLDEINSLANHAGQIHEEIKFMGEDFVFVERFVLELRILAKDFRPAPESHDLVRLNANVKVDDPREELELFERKMHGTIADFDRAEVLLKKQRAAIADLLSGG